MKTFTKLSLFVTFLLIGCSSSSIQNQTLTGHIENNSEYRGGANPPQFILDGLAIYYASANQNFYVRNATNYSPFTTVITTFSTDANGNFSINLPSGNYAVICQEKYDFEQHPQATAICSYLQEPDFTITVFDVNEPNYSYQYTNKANFCYSELPN